MICDVFLLLPPRENNDIGECGGGKIVRDLGTIGVGFI